MTEDVSQTHQPLAFSRIALYGLIAIVGSIALNLVIRAIGMTFVDVSPEFEPLGEAAPTIVFTTVLVFLAVIVFAIVDRVAANPVRVFNIIALVALALSVIPDLGLLLRPDQVPFGGITAGAVAIMILIHIAAYAVTVYSLTVLAYRE